MTARDALLWFGIGMPVCSVLLVLLDRFFAPVQGRFVPLRYSLLPSAELRTPKHRNGAQNGEVRGPSMVDGPVATPTRSSRAIPVLVASVPVPRPMRNPWAPGDNLLRPLVTGATPAPSTVRKRAWMAYSSIASRDVFDTASIERLERGRPPLRYNPLVSTLEAMKVDVDTVGRARVYWPDNGDIVDPFALAARS